MKMVRRGEFLEWAEVHGQLYGTSRGNIESASGDQALLFEVDCKGARKIQEHLPQAVMIFIMTPSFEDLVERIRQRSLMSQEELSVRIRTAREELRQVRAFEYVVVNDRFPEASRSFQSILRAGSCLRERVLPYRINRWEEEIRRYETSSSG
jgi:guanylate kinase